MKKLVTLALILIPSLGAAQAPSLSVSFDTNIGTDSYEVEASPDLVTWSVVKVIQAASCPQPPAMCQVSLPTPPSRMCYRAVGIGLAGRFAATDIFSCYDPRLAPMTPPRSTGGTAPR